MRLREKKPPVRYLHQKMEQGQMKVWRRQLWISVGAAKTLHLDPRSTSLDCMSPY